MYILQPLVHSDRSLSTECLWSNSRTQTRPKTIAPHWSSSYPKYLSPVQGQEEQQRVVCDRLHSHRANLAKRLSTTKERYLAARRELNPKATQAESSHDLLYRDKNVPICGISCTVLACTLASSGMFYCCRCTSHLLLTC